MRKIYDLTGWVFALILGGTTLMAGCARDDSTGETYDDEARAERIEEDLEAAGEDLERAGEDFAEGARKMGEELDREAGELRRELEPRVEDGVLVAKVKARLASDPEVNPLEIDVDVVDGVVTLGGRVDTEEERAEAVKLASRTEGVREVVDNLQVGGRS